MVHLQTCRGCPYLLPGSFSVCLGSISGPRVASWLRLPCPVPAIVSGAQLYAKGIMTGGALLASGIDKGHLQYLSPFPAEIRGQDVGCMDHPPPPSHNLRSGGSQHSGAHRQLSAEGRCGSQRGANPRFGRS